MPERVERRFPHHSDATNHHDACRRSADIGRDRSRDRRSHPRRDSSPEHGPRAHRLGELRQSRRARSNGLGDDEQVRRGLSRQALLRRVRVRGRRRVAGHRTGKGAVRRRACQRAAALRRPGQHVGLLRGVEAGRHRARDEPGPRWTSDARTSAQLFRKALHRSSPTASVRRTNVSTTTNWQTRRAAPAEADHRRRQRVSARHRLRTHRRRSRAR